jgi:hypothetical protein
MLGDSRHEPLVVQPKPSSSFYIWTLGVTVGIALVSALTGFVLWRSFQDKEEQNAGFLQKRADGYAPSEHSLFTGWSARSLRRVVCEPRHEASSERQGREFLDLSIGW